MGVHCVEMQTKSHGYCEACHFVFVITVYSCATNVQKRVGVNILPFLFTIKCIHTSRYIVL